MSFVQELLQKQAVQFGAVLFVGFLLGFAERKWAVRNVSGYRDYKIEGSAIAVLFFGSAALVALTEYLRHFEIFRPIQSAINSAPWWALILGASLIPDLINYFAHRLLHSEHFWRFHRWHHSPTELFWFTGFRGSFIHIAILGSKNVFFLTLSDMNPIVLAVIAVQGLYAQMAGHVNFDAKVPLLPKVLVTPQYHRIHHAVDRKLHDSNYSFVWTFWDKIFGTYTPPETVSNDFEIGLPESERVSLKTMITG